MTILWASDETLVTYLMTSISFSVLVTLHSVITGKSTASLVLNWEIPSKAACLVGFLLSELTPFSRRRVGVPSERTFTRSSL